MSKIFIDTNILVYSMDDFDLGKKERSRLLLRSLTKDFNGVISTQVMQEFYVAATRKLCVDPLIAKNILHSFERFELIVVTPNLIKEAIDCSIINQLSFWDSLILISAESANCKEVWTEDLNDGQIIRGVKIINPLK